MTTYVLGAGASRHVGYPLTATMTSELLRWMKEDRPPERMDYSRAAGRVEENFSSSENLEALLAEMEEFGRKCEAGTPEGIGIRTQLKSDRFMLACALQERFAEIRENPTYAYQEFVSKIVQPGDCIITFNYDVSLDRELRRAGKWQVGDGYGFGLSSS
jgi:hypothetical protein